MADKRLKKPLQWLRRVIGLTIAIVGVWALSLTADLSAIKAAMQSLMGSDTVYVAVLKAELGTGALESAGLSGWGRLLTQASGLLASGAEDVERQWEIERTQGEPISVQEEDTGQEKPELTVPRDTQVVEHTAVGRNDGSFVYSQQVYIKNTPGLDVDIDALAAADVKLPLGEGPQILIVHTHGTEAYTMQDDDLYLESDPYRTTDCNQNVIRVGEEMAQVFREAGFQVLHDTNLYDYPNYNGAYDRSREGVKAWLAQYPSICLVLDVHRDALVSDEGVPYKLVAEAGDLVAAQIMLVVGSDDGGAEHPDWRKNLALAVQLQLQITGDYTQLARPIALRSSRFNQDLVPGSLLVEVGGHGNTLQEAIVGGRLFAQSTAALLKAQMGT